MPTRTRRRRGNLRVVKRKPIKKKKSISAIVFTTVVFLFFIVYLGGYVAKMFNKQTIPSVKVAYGSIGTPDVMNGIIIRKETVYTSTAQGTLMYNIADGERIPKNGVVCYVQDEAQVTEIQSGLSALNSSMMSIQKDRGDFSLFSDDIKRTNSNIKTIVDEGSYKLLTLDMSAIYNMKKNLDNHIALRNQIMLGENRGSLASMAREKEIYKMQLAQSQAEIVSTESGVVSYALDGLEGKITFESIDNLSPEQLKSKPEIISMFQNKAVNINDPLFKIIESNEWYIASYIPNNLIDVWSEDSFQTIYIKDRDNDTYIMQPVYIYKLITYNEDSYVVMKCTKGLLNVIDRRNVDFKLVEKPIDGLKIPNTSIVDVSLFKIPLGYIADDDTLTKKTADSTVKVSPIIKSKSVEGNYALILQDFTNIKFGDIIVNQEGTEYQISELQNAKGVYILNSGIAEFKSITIDDKTPENTQYTILNAQLNPSIRVQDTIVSDAKNISEGQTIF